MLLLPLVCQAFFHITLNPEKVVRFEDVDGNEWLDFMCGFGAILHGYLHPEIEAAAEINETLGLVFNQPSPVMVTLAESITNKIEFADWSVLQKVGLILLLGQFG